MKTQTCRTLLKCKSFFLAEYPNAIVLANINRYIEAYKKGVGLPTYLSEMLGDLANKPALECTYYNEVGLQIHYTIRRNERVFDLLKRQASLPFQVKHPDYKEGRYL